jgi:hypothetical protein
MVVMNRQEITQALTLLVDVFEELDIPYHIGGSVASSVFGDPRSTLDIDVVANIQTGHVPLLVRLLEPDYYIDADMIRDAIRRRSSFNIIYLDTMLKIDIFIPQVHPFAQQERRRTQLATIEEGTRPFYLSSPEDVILNKLQWYRMGDGVSQRQWGDVLGVLHRQKSTLDFTYLHHWADNLQVDDLLEQALLETHIKEK